MDSGVVLDRAQVKVSTYYHVPVCDIVGAGYEILEWLGCSIIVL